MSKVIFGGSFSFITAATPSTGWIVGYDTDGIIKQKDSSGVITPIGGGPTAGNSATYSLSQVLAVGNNSQNYSIIMGTSSSIRSSRGGGQLNLDYASSQVLISNDNGVGNKSKFYLSDSSVDIINANSGSRVSLKSDKIDIVNGTTASGPTGNRVFINSNSSDGKVLLGVNTTIDAIKISATQGSTNITTNSTKEGVIVSSQNSYFDVTVRNSVILGGSNVVGVSSDAVYVPRVIIPQTGIIGTELSNSNIEFNDEIINLYNSNSIISLSTSTQSLSKNGIILVDTTSQSTTPNVDSGVTYINTKNSTATASINNSVVIGGQNLSALNSDTVYLGNSVNINGSYTLPSTDGTAGYILKTDGLGNVTWQQDGGADAKAFDLTLAKGNNSATYSVIMGTGTSIKSSNGGGQIDLDFSTLANRVVISTDSGGISTAYIELDNSDINIQSNQNIVLTAFSTNIQSGDGTGIQYNSNYSSGFVDRSLVDKQYVDIGTASLWNRISNTATGSGVSNYIPKWNSVTNLSSTSSIYISNAATANTLQTTLSGNNDPYDVAFDSYNERFYVVNSGSNNVTVRSSSTLGIIGTVSVGTFPIAITFDSYNNRMYVANKNSNNVSVIDTLTNTVTSTISVGTLPVGIEFDKVNNRVYVACQTANSISIISTSTNTVIGTISTTTPRGLAYDFNNNNLYVSGVGPDKVACIDLSTNSISATVSVGTNPYGLAYDSQNKRIYVANYVSNSVSVISTLTNSVTTTFGVGSNPDSVEFDKVNSRIYVTNYSTGNVSVISTLTNTVISTVNLTGGPRGLAYDDLNGKIYVANFGNDSTDIIEAVNRKDGYIGIGTSNPTSELDVRGKLTTKEFRLTTGANSGYYLVSDDLGNGTWQYPIIQMIGGAGLTGGGTSGVVVISANLKENSGLTFSGDDIIVDTNIAGNGLDISSGVLTVNTSEITSTLAGNGLASNSYQLDVNVGNGLQLVSDTVYLGGTISQNTIIDGNSNSWNLNLKKMKDLSQDATNITLSADQTFNINGGATISISIGDIAQITDIVNGYGFVYSSDYSSTFVTHSLVDKNYVDSVSNSKYTITRGFTASITETITHSLGTDEIIVQAYDSTGIMVIPGTVQINGVNAVDITFSSTLSSVKIIVIG